MMYLPGLKGTVSLLAYKKDVLTAETYIITLDQGTTSSRAVLVDRQGRFVDSVQREFGQIYPKPGWVEHNPQEIIFSQLGAMTQLITDHALKTADIDSIGITNQRETTVVWDRETGRPIANAIVWQCRRTAPIIDELCHDPAISSRITAITGLRPDAYFSASKIKWLLDNVDGARNLANAGKLMFGTIDCWLIWNLTGGSVHATDVTNASRTMLYDIQRGCWDKDLLALFGIPLSMMPEVRPSSGYFGSTDYPNIPTGIAIRGVAGDQQSALFGQCCFEAGQAKNTYGTGCFLLMHTGQTPVTSKNNLVTTIAASAPGIGHTEYALEGSVFVAGALIQWLRDELGIIQEAAETQHLAQSIPDTGGVYIVPAFTGMGAPYWKPEARGAIYGLTRGTGRAELARAALEALAYQVNDLADAMTADSGVPIRQLNADGGASSNDFLLQFQSDILRTQIRRPANIETTALGAAFLAGLSSEFWKNTEALRALRETDEVFEPKLSKSQADALIGGWKEAVRRTL